MSLVHPVAKAPHHYQYLDGIRGWAALIVVFGHITTGVISLSRPKYGDSVFLRFFLNGHFSVLVFFVLSGLVLSAGPIATQSKNVLLVTTARYFRLSIPIFATSLIAYLILKAGLFYNVRAADTPDAVAWLGRFYRFDASLWDAARFSFFGTFFDYSETGTYNSSLWTMPFEILGSYVIYAYLAVYRRTEKVFWVAVAVLYAFLLKQNPMVSCFITGYTIAELKNAHPEMRSRYAEWFSLGLFLVIILIATFDYPGDERVQTVLAALFVFAVSYSRWLRKFYCARISSFLGHISFPLYLIQIIVICSWTSYLRINLPLDGFSTFAAANIMLSTSLLISMVAAYLLTPVEAFSVKYSKVIARQLLRVSGVPFKKKTPGGAPADNAF